MNQPSRPLALVPSVCSHSWSNTVERTRALELDAPELESQDGQLLFCDLRFKSLCFLFQHRGLSDTSHLCWILPALQVHPRPTPFSTLPVPQGLSRWGGGGGGGSWLLSAGSFVLWLPVGCGQWETEMGG